MTEKLSYFAYGSNMLSRRLQNRVPSASNPRPVYLNGYRIIFHKKGSYDASGKCGIIKTGSGSDQVYGAVFDMHENERDTLDVAEGLGNGYELENVRVNTVSDQVNIMAFTYVPTIMDESLKPFHWYKDLVIAGAYEQNLPNTRIG